MSTRPNDLKRLSRLTAILTLLQSKRIITATLLAEKFNVNVRTIYRDIKALEGAGIPIFTEEGKGYSIVEGFHVPPVMFTEREAIALMTAEQIILRERDASLSKEFSSAVSKIKSVLRYHEQLKIEILEKTTFIGNNYNLSRSSDILIDVQIALTEQMGLAIEYRNKEETITNRAIEPYLLYHSMENNWVLVAYCKLRQDFRSFRLDRILAKRKSQQKFTRDNKTIKKYVEENFLSL